MCYIKLQLGTVDVDPRCLAGARRYDDIAFRTVERLDDDTCDGCGRQLRDVATVRQTGANAYAVVCEKCGKRYAVQGVR